MKLRKIAESEYDSLEDEDEFSRDEFEEDPNIIRQATVPEVLVLDEYMGDDHNTVYHFYEVGVTPWDNPEVFENWDEVVERAKPLASKIIEAAVESCEETIRWLRSFHPEGLTDGDTIILIGQDRLTPRQAEKGEWEEIKRIEDGDLDLALRKILR